VLAFDEDTGEIDYKEVVGKVSLIRDTIYSIFMGDEVLEASSTHPFYVQGKWIDAVDLLVGDTLMLHTEETILIDSIKIDSRRDTVYNISVEDFETYFVSEIGVLVHNCEVNFVSKRSLQSDSGGLKDHARRHSSLSPEAYLKRGKANVKNGIKVKGGGKAPSSNYHIRKIGDDNYSVSITNKKGEIVSIDTWSKEGKAITKDKLMDQLKKSGVTLTKEANKSLGL